MEPLRSFLLLTWYKMGKKSSRFLLLDGQTTCNHFGNMTAPPPKQRPRRIIVSVYMTRSPFCGGSACLDLDLVLP